MRLSEELRLAVRSIRETGHLPATPFWGRMVAHPERLRHRPFWYALALREHLFRQGKLTAAAPLFGPFNMNDVVREALTRHELQPLVFSQHHPFVGGILDAKPRIEPGVVLVPPKGPHHPIVPEPPSAWLLMGGILLVFLVVFVWDLTTGDDAA